MALGLLSHKLKPLGVEVGVWGRLSSGLHVVRTDLLRTLGSFAESHVQDSCSGAPLF